LHHKKIKYFSGAKRFERSAWPGKFFFIIMALEFALSNPATPNTGAGCARLCPDAASAIGIFA
jgi:hypothetical protein